MKLIFSLLFFFFYLNFSSVLARGPERSLFSTSFSGSTGHLFEGNPSETSIGKSVSGFPLWVIEILDKPGVEEPEPAFKFIGNVPRDEPVGRELLILLANWICNNHMKDPLVRLIAENMHLHILPSMNPDGYTLKRRGNASNIDLNHDFPDQGSLEVLVQKTMHEIWRQWSLIVAFVVYKVHLLQIIHGMALKIKESLIWTNFRRYYYGCLDDEAFGFLASVYSCSHYYMSLSTEFQGGIMNGALVEISGDKWPSSDEVRNLFLPSSPNIQCLTQLPTIWEYNKMSMLNLVASLVKTGVRGRIFSSDSGTVEGHCLAQSQSREKITRYFHNFILACMLFIFLGMHVNAGRAVADHYRLLTPGKRYEVMASMPGYKPKSTIIWLEETATADFILDPDITLEGNTLGSICD
ncbi:hypothetical protein CUMW_046700 [Citrus unshiu]|nr:hypothetical protein CUMW_046700 [Citrus unshiu]